MIRYLLIILLSSQAMALTTIARVGEDFITDYDVAQNEKIITWLGQNEMPQSKLSAFAKEASFHMSQIMQLASAAEMNLTDHDTKHLIDLFAKHKNLTVDALKEKVQSAGIEWSNFTRFIQTEVIEKRLIFTMYKDKVSPSSREVKMHLKKIQLSNPVNVSVLTAPKGTKITEKTWQESDGNAIKVAQFTSTPIGHLPDVYQDRVLAMKSGELSAVFEAFGKLNQIRVNEYKKPELDHAAIQDVIIQEKLRVVEPEWVRYLATNYPVKYL